MVYNIFILTLYLQQFNSKIEFQKIISNQLKMFIVFLSKYNFSKSSSILLLLDKYWFGFDRKEINEQRAHVCRVI